jgi:hypothetical protein
MSYEPPTTIGIIGHLRQTDGTELVNWPLLAQKLRGILSQQDVLKIVPWQSLAGVQSQYEHHGWKTWKCVKSGLHQLY